MLGPDASRWPLGEKDPGYLADVKDKQKRPQNWGINSSQAAEAAGQRVEKEKKRTVAVEKKHGKK